jgi:hypothetical protein
LSESSVVYIKHCLNPHNRDVKQFYGKAIAELDPAWERPYIAMLDGEAVLRHDWAMIVPEGSVLVFVDVEAIPQGGGGGSNPLQMVLMLAVIAISVYTGGLAAAAYGGYGTAAGSMAGGLVSGAVMMAGSMLVNAVVRPPTQSESSQVAQKSASPTYNLQAQGNTARLEGAIPEHFGYHILYPDYATMPYQEYAGNEQYLYSMLVIGRGYYDIHRVYIEDTPIENFEEVALEIVQPYQQVALFPGNVVTSSEAAGQELDPGVWYGGFVANPSGTICNSIGLDFVAPKGQFWAQSNGTLVWVDIHIVIEARLIDDNNNPLGLWFSLMPYHVERISPPPAFFNGTWYSNGTPYDITTNERIYTAATITPQRYSEKFQVAPGRYEVRVMRTSGKSTDQAWGGDLMWTSLRGYLRDDNNYGDITLLAVRMRATSQLSNLSARKMKVLATRRLPIWNGSSWSAPTTTRSIAWAFAYACKAVGLSDSQIDLATLLTLDSVWAARGDTCDGRVDSFSDFMEVLTKIAGAGRAKPYVQSGVVRLFRDQAVSIPVGLFSERNIIKDSFNVSYLIPDSNTADCVDVGYFDGTYWSPRRVKASLPGSTSVKPAKIETNFIISRDQAYREGIYQAASNKYRRKLIKFQTEMEGFIPTLGDLITVQHSMPGWGSGGDIVDYYTVTNSCLYSEQLYTLLSVNWAIVVADWSVASSTAVGHPLNHIDPVTKFTSLRDTHSDWLIIRKQGLSLPAGPVALSFYIYVPVQSGITSFSLMMDIGDVEYTEATAWSYQDFTKFGEWVRFEGKATLAATRTFVDIDMQVNHAMPLTGFVCYISCMQVETGTLECHEYIKSVGSATTAAFVETDPPYSTKLIDYDVANNRILYSEDFSNSAWLKGAGGTGTAPVVTANQALAPDGVSLTADRVDFYLGSGTTSTDQSLLYQACGSVIGQPCIQSVWLKTIDNSVKIMRFDFYGVTGDMPGYNANLITVTGDWQEFKIGLLSPADTLRSFSLRLRGSLTAMNDTARVYIWGAHQENASALGPYAKTTDTIATNVPVAVSTIRQTAAEWDTSRNYVMAMSRKDGSTWGPVAATRVEATTEASGKIRLASAPDFTPYTGMEYERTRYVLGWDNTWSQKARVINIRPSGAYAVEIEAVGESSNVHTAETGLITPEIVVTQLERYTTHPVVKNLTAVACRDTVYSNMLTWSPAPWADSYEIQQSRDKVTWGQSIPATGSSYRIDLLYGPETVIRVCAIGAERGPWVEALCDAQAFYASLPDVSGFSNYFRAGITYLFWTPVDAASRGAIGYEIRKGATWDSAQLVARTTALECISDGDGTYLIKAYSEYSWSANAVSLTVSGSSIVKNVIATWDERGTSWSGTCSGGAAPVGGYISLAGSALFSSIATFSAIASLMWYGGTSLAGTYEPPASHVVDIGTVSACTCSLTYGSHGDNPFTLISSVPVFSEMTSVKGDFGGSAWVQMQIAVSNQAGTYGSWVDFYPGEYVGRMFKFRANLFSDSPGVVAVLEDMIIRVDVPDIIKTGSNVAIAAGGTTISYPVAFHATPNVQVTIYGATAGDDIVLSAQSSAGFTVRIMNGGSGVARNINWLAQGY